jgi:hypothetical protein
MAMWSTQQLQQHEATVEMLLALDIAARFFLFLSFTEERGEGYHFV